MHIVPYTTYACVMFKVVNHNIVEVNGHMNRCISFIIIF